MLKANTRTKWPADLVYSSLLFIVAVFILIASLMHFGTSLRAQNWGMAVFFILYGVFTITIGYPHPMFGHVSFDRVAQVSSILVLGPVDAAWINGLASLVYPWHRLFSGVPLQTVLTAALHNSGLMTIIILMCGSLYTSLNGPIPLEALSWMTLALLFILMVSMQLLNEIGMQVLVFVRGDDPAKLFNYFSTAVELSAGVIAVLVAIVFNRMEIEIFVLLLTVLSLGMLTLAKFAHMRHRLELIVEERTRALRQKTLQLEQQATHDKLTGLFNRRYADDYLDREIENAQRYQYDFTIALADIDFFKRINDHFSHEKGDEVLQLVARILKDRCRKTDMIARYGGEEFLLCFPGTDKSAAITICEELREAIETTDWSFVDSGTTVTLSFGIAESFSECRRKTILSLADNRLYEAKYRGRNLVVA